MKKSVKIVPVFRRPYVYTVLMDRKFTVTFIPALTLAGLYDIVNSPSKQIGEYRKPATGSFSAYWCIKKHHLTVMYFILQHTIFFLNPSSFPIISDPEPSTVSCCFTLWYRSDFWRLKYSIDAVFPHRKLQSGAKAGLLAQIYNSLPPSRLKPVTLWQKAKFSQ